jgi:D-alanyl-D-alanine carboxypeptidase (penicillin-binding protein 5/6)
MHLERTPIVALLLFTISSGVFAAREKIPYIVNDPYTGFIVVDGESGEVILEENADTKIYPASVIKLMDLLLVIEQIEEGRRQLDEWVHVTPKAARMGGSQVYLKEGETFTLEEMLFALSIKSANDVAMALALHVAGTEAGFIKLMNERAAELGMQATEFHSVHGLPPDAGEKPDISTARDLATLSLEIVKHPQALTYTSTIEKWFRNNTFEMLTHNRLLRDVEGCDGLKTGYISAGGFSIAASAKRRDRRIIAVVVGCKDRRTRDNKARELLAYGFMNLPERKQPEAVADLEPELLYEPPPESEPKDAAVTPSFPGKVWRAVVFVGKLVLGLVGLFLAARVVWGVCAAYRRKCNSWKYRI